MSTNPYKEQIIEKALSGTITSEDFKGKIIGLVQETSSEALKNIDVSISKTTLDWKFPVPVVDSDSQNWVKESISLTNNGKVNKKLYYEIEIGNNPKIDLQVDQPCGELKKGVKVPLTFSLRVFCTTKVYQMIKIKISTKNTIKGEKKKFFSQSNLKVENTFKSTMKEEDIFGVFYACFKIESELSSSIDYDEIQLGPKIAKGGFGTVYEATWRTSKVAVKKLSNIDDLVEDERQAVRRELKILGSLSHAHVVTYLGSTQIKGQPLCIVMEYVQGGSLTSLLKKPISEKFKCKLALDVANGMSFMHSNNIFHRDLKPDNLLVISPDPHTHINLKITDFGTSRDAAKVRNTSDYLSFNEASKEVPKVENLDEKPSKLTKGVGTLVYQAPEILAGYNDYSIDKTDIYSFGILLWEVFTQKEPFSEPPYNTFTKFQIIDFVKSGKRLEIPSTIYPRMKALIEQCWHQSPNVRPTFSECVAKLNAIYPKLKDDKPSISVQEEIPRGIDPFNYSKICWSGTISRNESEEKLKGSPKGTFLVRWSNHTTSYVLSYTTGGNKFQHIAYIRPEKDDSITVDKQDGTVSHYDNLLSYIDAMRQSGIITNPFSVQDIYERSPTIYDKAP